MGTLDAKHFMIREVGMGFSGQILGLYYRGYLFQLLNSDWHKIVKGWDIHHDNYGYANWIWECFPNLFLILLTK